MKEEGGKDYDFRVKLELGIDEKSMSAGELGLIEGVMAELFRMVLDNQVIEEE